MSFANIKDLLSEDPNSHNTQPFEQGAVGGSPDIKIPKESDLNNQHMEGSVYKPLLCASRAAVRYGLLPSGLPPMQSTIIQQYRGINPSRLKLYPLIMEARQMNIPRDPIDCPMCSSNSSVFLSDFIKHIKINHVRVPVEVLKPQFGSNVFIDPCLDDVNQNRCRMLYLVTDKIRYMDY